jgi:predicted DNA-binding transcriptional regulator YafY
VLRLRKAIAEEQAVNLAYTDAKGEMTARVVAPLGSSATLGCQRPQPGELAAAGLQ